MGKCAGDHWLLAVAEVRAVNYVAMTCSPQLTTPLAVLPANGKKPMRNVTTPLEAD
jgi:hypothetical protein